jgi:archaellin
MYVDCFLASSRIAQVDPGDEPLPEVVLSHTTSSTAAVETSRVKGEIISESGAPSHIQKTHPPQ